MTTRERIYVMASNGDELHLIAARLGLSPEEVFATLEDATHTPPELDGGSPTQFVYGYIGGQGFDSLSEGMAPLAQIPYDGGTQNPVLTIVGFTKAAPGATVCESELLGPESGTEWDFTLWLTIREYSGTRFFKASAEALLQQGKYTVITTGDLNVDGASDEDFTLAGAEGFQVKSTEGGLFYVHAHYQFKLD